MQKKFFVFLVALVWAFSLAGASISLSHVGIKGPSSNPVIPGQTVYIKVDYSLTDFDEEFGSVDGVCASTSGPYDKARIYWYESTDGSGSPLSYTDATASRIERGGIVNSVTYID